MFVFCYLLSLHLQSHLEAVLSTFRILSCTNSKKNGNVFSKADVSVERTDHRWENQCSELTFDHLKRGYHLKGCS